MISTRPIVSLRGDRRSQLRRISAFVSVAMFALALCACVSTTREHFYTLTAVAQAPEPATPAATQVRQLSVGPVTIPEIVDRPQLVVRRSANQVEILEAHRWAQSLATDIAHVLAANLATLLPQVSVLTQDSPGSASADTRVAIAITQFDAMPGEAVTVTARWSLRPPRTANDQPMGATVREPVRGPGEEALAAGFDRALARLSAEIADDLARTSIFPQK